MNAIAGAPKPGFILGHMIDGRSRLTSIDLVGKVTDLKNSRTFNETLHVDYTNAKIIANYTNDADAALGSLTGAMNALHPLGVAWLELELASSTTSFKKAVDELGVAPTEGAETKLTRIGTRPVWSWGEESRIAIEKDEFAVASYKNASQLEFLVDAFTDEIGGVKVPKKVTIKSLDQPLYRYELKTMKMNVSGKVQASAVSMTDASVREWVGLVR